MSMEPVNFFSSFFILKGPYLFSQFRCFGIDITSFAITSTTQLKGNLNLAELSTGDLTPDLIPAELCSS